MRIYSDHEAKRYDFYEYANSLLHLERHVGDNFPTGTPLVEKYAYAAARAMESAPGSQLEETMDLLLRMEGAWHATGCPYYKVWPGIGEALKQTEMTMTGEYLRLPHPSFVIRMPKQDNPTPCFAAGIVTTAITPQDKAEGGFMVLISMQTQDRATRKNLIKLRIRPGKTVDSSLGDVMKLAPVRYDTSIKSVHGQDVLFLTVADFCRIAIGVCFFGANQHEMVMPDMTRKIIDRFQRLDRQPTEQEYREALEQSKRAGLGGYKVGSEIDLPSPDVRYHGIRSEETGRELTQGHVRRGHMRMQPVGPGRQQRKLVFVHPCLVRPDLPMGQARGYRIRESVN